MENAYEEYKEKADAVFRTYGTRRAISYLTDDGATVDFSFSDIRERIHALKGELEQSGVVRGDRAAVVTPHSPYGVMAGLALACLDITSVLIDATLPAEEVCRLLEFSDVRALFTTEALMEKIRPGLTGDIPCFALGADQAVHRRLPGGAHAVRRGETTDREPDVVSVIYSSGTTDQVKGVKVTYRSVLLARDIFADLSGLREGMSYLLVLPFNHIAGFTGAMTYFLTGCELDFLEHVDPSGLQRGLRHFQPHYFAMVPRVYEVIEERIRAELRARGKVAERAADALLSLSGFLRRRFGLNIGRRLCRPIVAKAFGKNIYGLGTGASPCRASTAEFFLNLGLEWANLYATTETGVPIVATGIHDRYPSGTVGNVNRYGDIQVRIDKPDGDGVGEITVRTGMVMKGYFRRPDLTEAAFTGEYFRTGDYGYIDKKGDLHITGRVKEAVLLRSGKKVSPSDIDAYYGKCCGGVRIASCGVAGPDGFDRVHLFLETHGQDRAAIEEARGRIQAQSSDAGSIYQVFAIHEIDRIPLTSVGKVKRFLLQEAVKGEESGPNFEKTSEEGSGNVSDIVQSLILSVLRAEREIAPDSRLREDLGMDSLEIFELCVALEEKFGVSAESHLHDGMTVGEICALIYGERNGDNVQKDFSSVKKYPVKRSKHLVRRLRAWVKFLSLPYKFNISGIENIPEDENVIICANHASFLDSIWLLNAIGRQINLEKIAGLAAQERLEGAISRTLFSLLGEIPVNRTGNTAPALYRAKECLTDEKYTMIIFPEGARSRDGSMLPFKNGAAKLAVDCGKKILPVYIDGSFEIFPRHKKMPRIFDWRHFRRFSLSINCGNLIRPDAMNVRELTKEIENQIILLKG